MQTTLTLISILLLVSQTVRAQCSGSSLDITLSTTYEIGSLTYPSNGSYTENLVCVWKLSSSSPSTEDVLMYLQINQLKALDILTIKDGTDNTGSPIFTSSTSGTAGQSQSVVAVSGNAYITFTIDSVVDSNQNGFTIQYMAASSMDGGGCSSPASLTATDATQYLTSANFPSKYPSESNCTWSISVQDSCGNIVMDFILIDLESDCSVDKVTVTYDGNSQPDLCPSTDWNSASDFNTTGTSASITMISDDSDEQQGFVMSYTRTGCTTTTQPTTTTQATTTTQPKTTTQATSQITIRANITPLMTTLVDGSPWVQSGHTNVQFTPTQITGMPITITGQSQSNWIHVKEEPNLIIYRSDQRFKVDGQLQYGYLCMAITYTDANNVYYYLYSDKEDDYTAERIHFSVNADATVAECCCPKYDIPGVDEYKVLSKPGASKTITGNVQQPLAKVPICPADDDKDDNSMVFAITFGPIGFVMLLGCFVLIRELCPQSNNPSKNP